MNKRQAGFTLIELVIVVTIIGILAAVALPRYINLQSQARTAKAQALVGSIKSAAALARANCMVDLGGLGPGTCTATGGTTNMDGATIDMVNQYPAASLTGIIRAAQIDPATDGVSITAGNPIIIDIDGGTVPNCRISYSAATAGPTAPVVTLDKSGC